MHSINDRACATGSRMHKPEHCKIHLCSSVHLPSNRPGRLDVLVEAKAYPQACVLENRGYQLPPTLLLLAWSSSTKLLVPLRPQIVIPLKVPVTLDFLQAARSVTERFKGFNWLSAFGRAISVMVRW